MSSGKKDASYLQVGMICSNSYCSIAKTEDVLVCNSRGLRSVEHRGSQTSSYCFFAQTHNEGKRP